MRVYKTKAFARFARKERIADAAVIDAVRAAEVRPDADLGGGVIKQRVARPGRGKSGGYRTIVLFRRGDKAFFVYGYAKHDRGNISNSEERAYKELASIYLSMSIEQIQTLIDNSKIMKVGGK